jgi:hypothetical protein
MNPAYSICPECGKKGYTVDGATVKSMLAVSLRHVRDTIYRFCTSSNCDVVYYSDDGTQTFTKQQVRERVYLKEPEADDVLICYCFQHTLGDVRQHVEKSAQAIITDDINAGIQAGQCACDWRNPQGNCCLGNVRQLINRLERPSEKSPL